MTNILVCLPYCVKDAALAKNLLAWMGELHGKYSRNAILLVADNDVPLPAKKELNESAKSLFGQAETMLVDVPQGQQGRIHGANQMFYQASRQVQECYRLPFLWLEPDAVPLKRMWLEELTKEYNAGAKRFMGQFTRQGTEPISRLYLPACSVLPNNAHELLITGPRIKGWLKPWDIESAAITIARAQNTALIQEHHGETDLPPSLAATKEAGAPCNFLTPGGVIRKEAVIFHGVKDGTLIQLLRKARAPRPEGFTAQEIAAEARNMIAEDQSRTSETIPA